MSEAALGRAGAPEGSPRWITWRDALTPLSRASRRRWALFYAALLTATGAVTVWRDDLGWADDATGATGPPFVAIIGLFVVFGMLRRGTRRLTAADHPDLDERDQAARDLAFRLAYPLLLVVVAASVVALWYVLPDIERRTPVDGATSIDAGHFLTIDALLALLLWGFLWATFLPTAVLAWREPDAVLHEWEEAHPRAGPSEAVRDAALAVALVGALALSLPGHSGGLGLLVLATAVVGLSAWTRRAVGQRAISAELLGAVGTFLAVGAGVIVTAFAIFGVNDPSTTDWLVLIGILLAGIALLVLSRRRTR